MGDRCALLLTECCKVVRVDMGALPGGDAILRQMDLGDDPHSISLLLGTCASASDARHRRAGRRREHQAPNPWPLGGVRSALGADCAQQPGDPDLSPCVRPLDSRRSWQTVAAPVCQRRARSRPLSGAHSTVDVPQLESVPPLSSHARELWRGTLPGERTRRGRPAHGVQPPPRGC